MATGSNGEAGCSHEVLLEGIARDIHFLQQFRDDIKEQVHAGERAREAEMMENEERFRKLVKGNPFQYVTIFVMYVS